MSTTAASIILPLAKSASLKATNGVSTTTHNGASQISAANSTSSQSSWSSATSTAAYASSATSVSEEYKCEKTVYASGGLANAEVEFAKLMSEIPWMRFQVTATPDAAWLQEERFKAVFHALTQKTVKSTTARVISQVKVEMNKVLDVLAASEEHIDMATVIEDIQKAFVVGACGAVTNGQTLVTGHPTCGCGHKCSALPTPCSSPLPILPKPCPAGPEVQVPASPESVVVAAPTPAPSKPNLSTAQWIWTNEVLSKAPTGARSFRRAFTLNEVVDSMIIDITTDNYDTLYVNGKLVGSTVVKKDEVSWEQPRRYNVRFDRTNQVVVSVWAMQADARGAYFGYGPRGEGGAGLVLAGVAWNSQKKEPAAHHFCSNSSWITEGKKTSREEFSKALKLGSKYKVNNGHWEQVYEQGACYAAEPWGRRLKTIRESGWTAGLTGIQGSHDAPEADRADVL